MVTTFRQGSKRKITFQLLREDMTAWTIVSSSTSTSLKAIFQSPSFRVYVDPSVWCTFSARGNSPHLQTSPAHRCSGPNKRWPWLQLLWVQAQSLTALPESQLEGNNKIWAEDMFKSYSLTVHCMWGELQGSLQAHALDVANVKCMLLTRPILGSVFCNHVSLEHACWACWQMAQH